MDGLHGIYTCMALRLFDRHDDSSDAYAAMSILGHSGLYESLVYTTYHIGDDFTQEESLGELEYTPHTQIDIV